MSATIGANKLSFVIFANGHDYTLMDSGKGEFRFFSHPFVPLNSVNYAGQYYFLVSDEHGNSFDCVKDDIAHCTFTPALGTAFSTEGETTVKVNYHREYIYDDETIVVDKTVSQTIQVVNHGNVTSRATCCDLYSDGYAFYRPSSVDTASYLQLRGNGQPSKVSSIPWRVTVLGDNGYDFCNCFYMTDISELQYADTSNVVHIQGLFRGAGGITSAMAKEAIGNWDLSSLQSLTELAVFSSSFTDLSFMENWVCPNLTSLWHAFQSMQSITSLHGLEHLDFSHVTNMESTFDDCRALTDVSALANKDVSNVATMRLLFNVCPITNVDFASTWNPTNLSDITSMFQNCYSLLNVNGMSNWTSHITSMAGLCKSCYSIVDISGFGNLDISDVTDVSYVFQDAVRLKTLDGLENWDTGNVSNFSNMCVNAHWIEDISAMASWDFSSAQNMGSMFNGNAALVGFDGLVLDLSNVSNMDSMFNSLGYLYVDELACYCYETAYWYVDYEGNQYSKLGLTEHYVQHDATDASAWTVSISDANAFSDIWDNRPTWN